MNPPALFRGIRASFRKETAFRQRYRIGHHAFNRRETIALPTHIRQRVEKTDGIRMQRIVEDVYHGSVFNNFTGIANCHFIADFRNNSQIMGDHDHRRLKFRLQILHHIQHLRLNGNIKRRGRFIRQKKSRITCQCHRNNNALLHTTGKLMRIIMISHCRYTDFFQHRLGPCFPFRFFTGIMKHDCLKNLVSDRHGRIQGCHRILKDHSDLIPTDRSHPLFGSREKIFSVVEDFSAANGCRSVRKNPENAFRYGRLSGSGFSDKT